MHASVQPAYTWSHDYIFSGKSQKAVLLIEWCGAAQPSTGGKKSQKLVARDIELRIWLEPYVSLNRVHGCRPAESGDRGLLFSLGAIRSGQRKYIALEFNLESLAAGRHEMLWLQWRYRQRPGERGRELPVQKLSLEYSRHTGYIDKASSFYVEKHVELLKVEKTIAEALLLYADGQQMLAREKLRRHADNLLLMAARSGDPVLLREAESLYIQCERKSHQIEKEQTSAV
ncbi:hypothetical protein SAMN04487895_113126 [Paenibacillus sophorae]|uniref:Uncharacterized protein n=1 Tax=Paenibacillus sophorae TaxID=1333845 RepID=A0A1H8TAF5_9BACL|nr:hypothetical protein [Paenibacillus sophorae]QWU17162.1 hypothetical protein KP014_08350 [Paenibacillus sophorae]SEO87726.1 hypothetical protein SAMN04487895_113126 [Paenibacillus sophorae]